MTDRYSVTRIYVALTRSEIVLVCMEIRDAWALANKIACVLRKTFQVLILEGLSFSDREMHLELNRYESVDFFLGMLKQSVTRASYFETSSNRVLTPLEALEEAGGAFEAYELEPEQSWNAIPYALSRVVLSFTSSVLNHQILGLPGASAFKELIDTFAEGFRGTAKKHRKSYLGSHANDLKRALTEVTTEIEGVYWKWIIDRSIRSMSAERAYASDRDQIYRVVPELVTSMIYQGRDIEKFAEDVEKKISSLENGSFEAVKTAIEDLLKAAKEDYAVATVITGAVSAEIPVELNGRRVIFPGPISWGETKNAKRGVNRRKANRGRNQKNHQKFEESDLIKFCMEHWKVSPDSPNSDHKVRSQIVVWDVQAWDAVQARQIALDNSESLMDRINAEHRIGEFGVKRKVLVWNRNEPSTSYLADVFEGAKNTRVMRAQNSPSVQRSLRFASRASTERAGAMAVFFGWAALEYLGRGNDVIDSSYGGKPKAMTPQNFIAKHVPKVVALAAVHHLANEVSFAVSNQSPIDRLPDGLRNALKLRFRNVPNEHLDQRHLFHILVMGGNDSDANLNRLAELLRISKQEAKAVVEEFTALVGDMNQMDRYRIREIRGLLLNSDKMAEYLSGVEKDADVALQRMRFVRNQTAHSTIPESLRYKTLSNASREILDTCYQVIDKDKNHLKPHEVLQKLAQKYDSLIKDLRRGVNDDVFSPHRALVIVNS